MNQYVEEPYHYEDFKAKSPQNPEAKCLWVLCIDTSYSMTPHMSELHRSLQAFQQAVAADSVAADRIEVSIVTFNSEVKVRCAPKLIDDLVIPDMEAESATFLVEGIERAIQVVDNRVAWYTSSSQSFYQPFVTLITDGMPNGPGNIHEIANTIRERENHPNAKQRISFLSFGVTDADMDVLNTITADPNSVFYVKDADFASLFKFISTSMKTVGNSSPTDQTVVKQIQASAQHQENFQQTV